MSIVYVVPRDSSPGLKYHDRTFMSGYMKMQICIALTGSNKLEYYAAAQYIAALPFFVPALRAPARLLPPKPEPVPEDEAQLTAEEPRTSQLALITNRDTNLLERESKSSASNFESLRVLKYGS